MSLGGCLTVFYFRPYQCLYVVNDFDVSILFIDFSQLFYDGYPQLAVQLAKATSAHPSCPPSDRLMKVFSLGLKIEEGKQFSLNLVL